MTVKTMSEARHQFDSQDWIDDAIDSLHKSKFPYLVITGVNSGSTRIDSSMDNTSREALLSMARSGKLESMLTEHFERNPQA